MIRRTGLPSPRLCRYHNHNTGGSSGSLGSVYLISPHIRSLSYSSRLGNKMRARTSGTFNLVLASSVFLIGSYVAAPSFRSKIGNESPSGGSNNGNTPASSNNNNSPMSNSGGSTASFSTSAAYGIPRGPNGGKRTISLLSPGQVSSWLRENEESYFVERGKGVLRYDACQLASNNPIEDDRSERTIQVPLISGPGNDDRNSTDWMFWGIYDGHSGWTTSAKLRDSLINYVVNELDKAYTRSSPNSAYRLIPSPEVIDSAIQQGFLSLDDEIVHKSVDRLLSNPNKTVATEMIAPALSGSCGLLAFYDSHSQNLRVAVTGDSRAVLGSRNQSGHWMATALSTDQTGSNADEAHRIRSEHPGEEATAVRNGRVLGQLEPTRAFGDARYKWTRDVQNKISQTFFGRRTPSELKSPPYVTAKPEVTTTKVKPENGDFLVMASDGLFEMLSNQEIVSLVAQWMEQNHPEYISKELPTPSKRNSGLLSKFFGGSGDETQQRSTTTVEDMSTNKESQKQPLRRRAGYTPKFVVEDENVATHLIRNALGGADREQVSMLVSIPSPLSRNHRDDLTVTVVFFGEDEQAFNDAGTVKVNQLATKNNLKSNVRPKL